MQPGSKMHGTRPLLGCLQGRYRPYRGGVMQDPASELPRILIPRTSVNKGKEKGRGARPRPYLHRLLRNLEHLRADLHKSAEAGAAEVTESGQHDLAFPERFRPRCR